MKLDLEIPKRTQRKRLYALLKSLPGHMRIDDIAAAIGADKREVRNSLNLMLKQYDLYPDLWRFRCKEGKTWYSTNDGEEPERPQHPIMADLWRGWGSADRLGDGNDYQFRMRLKSEPIS